MKKRIWIVLCLLLCMVSGCGEVSRSYFEEASETEEEMHLQEDETEIIHMAETETKENSDCYVYICGAVVHPGVYKLTAGSRIYEVVSAAGGLLDNACEESINQAEEVTDGQMIKVLTQDEAQEQEIPKGEADAGSSKESDGKVNLNTAGVSELMTLPGIGETKAGQILSYREEKGGFTSIEEIMNITGIKEGVYSKIKDYITVN